MHDTRHRLVSAGLLAASVLLGRAAEGQVASRFGFDISVAGPSSLDDVGASLGATLHLGEHFALRPLATYSRTRSTPLTVVFSGTPDSVVEPTGQATFEQWGGGLGLLYYLKRSSELSPYLFSSLQVLRRVDTDPGLEFENGTGFPATREQNTLKLWRAGLGLQYALKDRLAVFGELGLRRSSQRGYSHTSAFSSSLGVIFYLR